MKSFIRELCALILVINGVFAVGNPCADIIGVGFVNDYSGCSNYFSCVNGVAFPVSCPGGLYFDAERQVCDIPDKVDCSFCPAAGIIAVGIPGSCTLYTLCINGEAFDRECGPGTMFDSAQGRCDLAELVECEGTTCPPTGNTVAPDPRSCSHYFVCSNGETIARRECAENLLFDQHLLACSRAELASCFTGWSQDFPRFLPLAPIAPRFAAGAAFEEIPTVPVIIPTVPPNIPTAPTVGPGDPEVPGDIDNGTTQPTSGTTQGTVRTMTQTTPANVWEGWPTGPITCPPTGIHYIGHHESCLVFQVCNFGRLHQVNCPPNQHWSPQHMACEWPDRANCPLAIR